jgi:TetR/AcrR family transcriptional repressor of nem operon
VLLKKAQSAGEISKQRDVNMLANYIIANFSGLWQTYIISQNKKLVTQMAEFLVEVVRQ